MNYTQNYHLPQWVKEDRIMMEDFNAMNSSIESGLTRTEGKADTAVSTANEAKQTADAAAAAKPYVVGSYTGDGGTQNIHLGFRPSFLVVSGLKETLTTGNTGDFDRYFGMSAGNIMVHRLEFTDTGFIVYPSNGNNFYYPHFNDAERVYDYIAFK